MAQYGFYFNGQRCTGCKTCVLACKDCKDLTPEISFRNVYECGGGSWTKAEDGTWSNTVFAYPVSIACNHCDNPMCFAACAQGCIEKDPETGLVVIDEENCIGCGACAEACPYHAPKHNAEKEIYQKCDGCAERVAAGQQPICVEACPLRALEFGPIDELRAAHGDLAVVAPLADPSISSPNLVITPSDKAESGEGVVLNEREIA